MLPAAVSTSVMFGYEVDGAPPCPNPELMENDDAPESFGTSMRCLCSTVCWY